MKTVEQLRAEAAAATEALQTAERETKQRLLKAEQEERTAKERAIQEQKNAVATKMITNVFNAMIAAGIKCELKGLQIRTGERQYDTNVYIEEQMDRSHSWRSRSTGMFTVIVGERYRDQPAVRYPQRADGTHNYAKIVAKVQERLQTLQAVAKREQQEKNDEEFVKALCMQLAQEFGLKANNYGDGFQGSTLNWKRYVSSGTGRGHTYIAPRGRVFMEGRALTPEQARVMFKALKEIAALEPKR